MYGGALVAVVPKIEADDGCVVDGSPVDPDDGWCLCTGDIQDRVRDKRAVGLSCCIAVDVDIDRGIVGFGGRP